MYFGDSVGHWEGDALVVDVTHLTDDTWLGISCSRPESAMNERQDHRYIPA